MNDKNCPTLIRAIAPVCTFSRVGIAKEFLARNALPIR